MQSNHVNVIRRTATTVSTAVEPVAGAPNSR